jgi:DNA-binding transcriptional regulator GbsR (MarR family)
VGIKKVRERFIEQLGLVLQGGGLPRIAGRLMGLMNFDGRPYSFGELAVELQISRDSISTNARILEQMGIIERMAEPCQHEAAMSTSHYLQTLNSFTKRCYRL